MGSFSILPESLYFIETWLVRIFLLLALITLGPWIIALLYDLLLYLWRSATYEMPYFGGRARGQRRPRVPTLTETSDGHRRQISLPSMLRPHAEHVDESHATGTSSEAFDNVTQGGVLKRSPHED